MKIKLFFFTAIIGWCISFNINAQVIKKLYGTTKLGGANSFGVIYSTDLDGKNYKVEHEFNGDEGKFPLAGLIQASDKKIYGTVSNSVSGSLDVYGGVFCYDPVNNKYKLLYEWDGVDITKGSVFNNAKLFQASDGRIYGTTAGGGSKGVGTLFSFDPLNSADWKWYDLNIDNSNPVGGLVEYNGMLWGITQYGGLNGTGSIFNFDFKATTPVPSLKFSFEKTGTTNVTGASPVGGLMVFNNKLYGVTSSGGGFLKSGVIFSYDGVFKSLYSIAATTEIYNSQSQLIVYNNQFYGLGISGGSSNYGGIFKFIEQPIVQNNVLHSLTEAQYPVSNFIRVNDDLYAVTTQDIKNNAGVLFKYNTSTNTFSILRNFNQGFEGYEPNGDVVYVELCAAPQPSTVSLTIDKTAVCSTTELLQLNVTTTNVGATPTYQWYYNGTLLNTTDVPMYTTTLAPMTKADFKVNVVTSNVCAENKNIVSNIVTVSLVAGNLNPPKVTLTQANNVSVPCNNTPVVFTATPEPAGVYEYRWFVKQNSSGTFTSIAAPLNTNTLTYAGSYLDSLKVEVNELCSAIGRETLLMNYSPIIQYSLDLIPDRTIVCENDKNIMFTASVYQAAAIKGGIPLPAGTTFQYQWFLNNNLIYTYTDARMYDTLRLTNFNNKDKVFVRVTCNNPCITSVASSFTSPITLYVNQSGLNNMSAALVTINNKVCSSSANVDLTIIPNGFSKNDITTVRLIRKSGVTLVNLNEYSFSITPPLENEQVYALIDIYNSCSESYTIQTNKINIQVSPYICDGFPTTPETSITGPKTVNLGETQNYAITLSNPSDTVFTKGVPMKFDWYYEISDKGVKKYYQAFVINNVQSSAPLGSNVFVSFPGNFKQGKLVSVSSMYRIPNNEYIPFDTNYYDVEVKTLPTITNALCSDSIGCSAFRIEQIKIANYFFNQSAIGIECPKSSKGYSDFTKAEYVYSDTLGNLYSIVNSYPEMYSGSTVPIVLTGKDSAQYYACWADINGDGDFTDANEFLGASSFASISYTSSLTLPFTDASITSLRLRVRCSNKPLNATDYCGTFITSKGETEDYMVTLVPYPTLEAPQAFTPGVDGLNDFLVIRGVDANAGPLDIKVYDKIGNLIYQNSNYQNDWNGLKNDGSHFNNGTYYITAINGSRTLKAFVELINETAK